MQAVFRKCKAIWSDESAQGATEYILLLAIVVGVAMIFGGNIKKIVTEKMGQISSVISGFSVGEN